MRGAHKEGAVAALVGAPARPLPRRAERPLPRPRLRRLDPGAAVRGRPGQRIPAVVLERAPWGRLQVRRATAAYEEARASVHRFARRPAGGEDVVVLVRNTTEAINHLAYRLGLGPTRGGHHGGRAPRQPAPLGAVATRRWVDAGPPAPSRRPTS